MVADVRTLLTLDVCKPDDRVQSRARLNAENVAYLRSILEDGRELDPIIVYREPEPPRRYWLASGFHRWHAHHQATPKRSHIEALIYDGDMRDAILFSVSCNDRHGLRRTTEDIEHTVRMLLADPEWGKWTDTKIATQCKLHHSTVARHREKWHREQESLSQSESENEAPTARTYVNKHGQTTTINVGNIGQRPEIENGYAGSEDTPANLPFAVKAASTLDDLKKLEKQEASAYLKAWRLSYRIALVRGEGVGDALAERVVERMEWARQTEIARANRKHGA